MHRADTIATDNPLPQRFLTDTPGVGGRIKQRPDDFLVDETALYEPEGTGEHLYLRVQKANVSHGELIATLCRHFNVRESAIGYAGMKDKLGITQQTVSIHLRHDPPSVEIPHERISVLWAERHRNKLRRGHLAGNRFSIRIREIDPMCAPRVLTMLRQLQEHGVPDYFGEQRFGYRRNNHVIGGLLLQKRWDDALMELLGTKGTPFPDHQQRARELFDEGNYADALGLWTVADRSERASLRALVKGASAKDACRAGGPTPWGFWLSAWQSAIFNRLLDARLEAGTFASFEEGDLAWLHSRRAVFPVTAEELARPELADRLHAFEVSPSGPIWGDEMMRASGVIAGRELAALVAAGITEDQLAQAPGALRGERRPFRIPITDIETDAGLDEHGTFVRIAFDLPRGAYATVVLREIMKNDDAET